MLAIGTMVARVTALRLGVAGQTALEVGAGQVVEDQVVGKAEQVAAALDQVLFNGLLVTSDFAETTIEQVEMQSVAGHAEQFGQGGRGPPAKDAEFAARLDQAIDGDQGGDQRQRHPRAAAANETLQQSIEAEQLPGTQADVDIAEAPRIGPGNGMRIKRDATDGTVGWRRSIADFLLEQGKPGGIGQPFGNAEPIGRSQVVEAAEIADGALPHPAFRRAARFRRGCSRCRCVPDVAAACGE